MQEFFESCNEEPFPWAGTLVLGDSNLKDLGYFQPPWLRIPACEAKQAQQSVQSH